MSYVSNPALVGAEVELFQGEFRPENIENNASECDIFSGFFEAEVIALKTVGEMGTSTQVIKNKLVQSPLPTTATTLRDTTTQNRLNHFQPWYSSLIFTHSTKQTSSQINFYWFFFCV